MDRRTDTCTHTSQSTHTAEISHPPTAVGNTQTHTLALVTSMHSPLCASGLVHTQYKSP